MSPPCIALACTVEQHLWLRPFIDAVSGAAVVNAEDIAAHCKAFVAALHASGKPLRVQADVKKCVQIYLHSAPHPPRRPTQTTSRPRRHPQSRSSRRRRPCRCSRMHACFLASAAVRTADPSTPLQQS